MQILPILTKTCASFVAIALSFHLAARVLLQACSIMCIILLLNTHFYGLGNGFWQISNKNFIGLDQRFFSRTKLSVNACLVSCMGQPFGNLKFETGSSSSLLEFEEYFWFTFQSHLTTFNSSPRSSLEETKKSTTNLNDVHILANNFRFDISGF